MTTGYKTISFTLTNGIGHVVLNQPPGNAMTVGFFSEFNRLVDDLKTMKELKAIVISGSGRHYSSGAELDGLIGLVNNEEMRYEGNEEMLIMNSRSFLFLEETEIPVISAIRGVCIGSAFELALFSHFRFCGEDAVFGLPETTFNLMPGIGGISRMAARCGSAKAIELVLKGSTFGAEEALKYQLVDRIVPKRRVVEFALAFAAKIKEDYRKQKTPLYIQKIHSDDLQLN
ncbi:MAG: enoyl-CoA hydratase/isomerase family protein [Bacteroidetes bacterium]|nr:enoyl-CoA hydratase/isomerase family protein [Bacteroidota bacterium]